MSPQQNQVITSTTIEFDVRAYPTRLDLDPPVKDVVVTVSWTGRSGPWLVACRTHPSSSQQQLRVRDDHYRCTWDPRDAGERVPSGDLRVSFDVYDAKGNVRHGPNGTHTIHYVSNSAG